MFRKKKGGGGGGGGGKKKRGPGGGPTERKRGATNRAHGAGSHLARSAAALDADTESFKLKTVSLELSKAIQQARCKKGECVLHGSCCFFHNTHTYALYLSNLSEWVQCTFLHCTHVFSSHCCMLHLLNACRHLYPELFISDALIVYDVIFISHAFFAVLNFA